MKKFILFLVLFILSIGTSFAQSDKLFRDSIKGSWFVQEEPFIQYTFDQDTLWIDEIRNEGTGYIYTVDSSTYRIIAEEVIIPEFYNDVIIFGNHTLTKKMRQKNIQLIGEMDIRKLESILQHLTILSIRMEVQNTHSFLIRMVM